MWIYIYIYMYIYIYHYIYIDIYMYIHMFVHNYVCIYTCVGIFSYTKYIVYVCKGTYICHKYVQVSCVCVMCVCACVCAKCECLHSVWMRAKVSFLWFLKVLERFWRICTVTKPDTDHFCGFWYLNTFWHLLDTFQKPSIISVCAPSRYVVFLSICPYNCIPRTAADR